MAVTISPDRSGGGTDAKVPPSSFRRSAPSPAEQARREQWGRTVGPLVKQAYTALQGEK